MKRILRIGIVNTVFLFVIMSVLPIITSAQILLTPSIINFRISKPDQVVSKNLTVKNTSTAPITIIEVWLKTNNQGFTVTNINVPFTLSVDSSKELNINFVQNGEGVYKDTVVLRDSLNREYSALLFAETALPIIEVSDIDFQTILATATRTEKMYIRNTGKVDLAITGWLRPTNTTTFNISGMDAKLQNASLQTPFIIPAGDSSSFDVTFNAVGTINTFTDKIVFRNDAKDSGTNLDNVGNLTGQSVLPQMTVTNFDWNRKRIQSRRTPGTPYMATITLENLGSATATVLQAKSPANTVFGYNVSDFVGLQLQPGEKKSFNVTFNPDVVGPHTLDITLETNDPMATPISHLRGIGIVPRITTKDVDFGHTPSQSGVPNVRQVEIECLHDQWEDSVTITDFLPVIAGTVGTSGTGAFGTSGFRFDLTTCIPSGKLVLQPGEKAVFNADFQAQSVGTVSVQMTTKSDALTEATSTWSGTGEVLGAEEISPSNFEIKLQESSPDAVAITLQLSSPERVRLILYDAVGRAVYSSDASYDAGKTTVRFSTAELATGIYRILAITSRQMVSLPLSIMR